MGIRSVSCTPTGEDVPLKQPPESVKSESSHSPCTLGVCVCVRVCGCILLGNFLWPLSVKALHCLRCVFESQELSRAGQN